jgi:hypothetical protein
MLTARKENNQSKSTPFSQRSPTMGSFDRVVDSIDGLRNRVQGVTLEQVSETDQRLQAMSLGLRELQRKLEVLFEIKGRIDQLQETVKQAKSESLEESMLAFEGEPVPIHAIAQVGNLLKLRQVIKLIKASQKASGGLAQRDQEVQAPVIFEPFEIVSKPTETSMIQDVPSIEQLLTEAPRNQATPVTSTESSNRPEQVSDPDPLEKELEEIQFFSNEAVGATQPDEAVGSIPIEDRHLESIDATEYPQLNRSFPVEEIPATSDHVQAHDSAETDFDRRLLDDLIKNYGEFSNMPSSSSAAGIHQEPKNEKIISTPRTDSSTALAPASQAILPLQRNDGDLDRKLKKLIKDYGEYDLYSRPTPLKLKTGVIAAFLVLSLVFSGFYFFSSPKSAIAPSVSSASQSQNDSAVPSKEALETRNGEPVSASFPPSGDTPKMIDEEAARNLPNKGGTKKTK